MLAAGNARITITITKTLRDEISKEAQSKNMILSEYAADVLRNRAALSKARSEYERVKGELEKARAEKPQQPQKKKPETKTKAKPKPKPEPVKEPPSPILETRPSEPVPVEPQTPGEIVYNLTDKTIPFEELVAYRDPKTGEIRHGIRHLKSPGHSVITRMA
jgi:hypothetical protein